MRVNFNQPFRDCYGNGIDAEKSIGDALCVQLFSVSKIGGRDLSADEKYMAYKLCKRIAGREVDVEISAEEAAFIKQLAAQIYSAGAYGQIVDLIENN